MASHLHWVPGEHASRYDVQFSDDGKRWRTVRRVTDGGGGQDALLLTESETRYLRLALHDGPKRGYALAELTVEDLAFGATPNAFFGALARDAPRGSYPRGFPGEQGALDAGRYRWGQRYGAAVATMARSKSAGAASRSSRSSSSAASVTTWADVATQPFLVDDDLPMPGVQWSASRFSLRITTFAGGTPEDVRLVARYDLTNTSDQPLSLTLAIAVRPFQVNPPAQFLSTVGGTSPIRDLSWDGRAMTVNGVRHIHPLSQPGRVGLRSFDAGPLVPWLSTAEAKPPGEVHDEFGYASGALFYPVTLAPYASVTLGVVVPLSDNDATAKLAERAPLEWLAREQANAAAAWRSKVDRVTIRLPSEAQPLADTLHTALAHILITRDGPRLRPGTRSYARSWIRDGTMIAESLLRLGHANVAADYLRWYAPHQFADGKVPCCVDARGADPVPENDSPGEFLFLAGEVYRYTYDRALLTQMWPHVEAAAEYMERLRLSERVAGTSRRPRPRCSACFPHRSATKAIPRSRCTRTGTTSGR